MATNRTFDNSGSAIGLYEDISHNDPAEVLSAKNADTLTFRFNLGQFNVDASMTQQPTFLDLSTVDLSYAHYSAVVSWYADVNETTLFRHLKGTFEISREVAIKYAKALGCDPAQILFNNLNL